MWFRRAVIRFSTDEKIRSHSAFIKNIESVSNIILIKLGVFFRRINYHIKNLSHGTAGILKYSSYSVIWDGGW
jgi:hypothetical protein